MDSIAKITKTCDECKAVLDKKDGDSSQHIEATLAAANGENKNYSFCGEPCLLGFLQGRAKKKKSKASLFEVNFSRYLR